MISPLKGTPGRSTPGRSRLGPPQRIIETGSGHKVRVVVRVRPFLPSEISSAPGGRRNCTCIAKGHAEDSLTISAEPSSRCEEYKLDACYGETSKNDELFAKEVEPLLSSLFEGCNNTVFAYGATGSGKTHTMQGTEMDPGFMLLAVRCIFGRANCKVAISYYEVYMDRCYDLLAMRNEVSVMEDQNGNIQFRGLAKVQIHSVEEFSTLLADGCARRRVGPTALNDVSSRSHGVLVVTTTSTDAVTNVEREAKLNLIDLAGNEDNRKTGNDGVRIAESSQINQSLFALSNVINALNANEARVPYRDSKLTRILRDSLGGSSRSVMVACLNPGSYLEATKTLSLAARSRQINHGERHDESAREKLDMAARLQAWREAKASRTTSKNVTVPSSPAQLKALMKSPPHAQSPKTPSSQRNLLERASIKTRVKINATRLASPNKENPIAHTSPLRTSMDSLDAVHSLRTDELAHPVCELPRQFSEDNSNNFTNPLFQDADGLTDFFGDEADKENEFQGQSSPCTPTSAKLLLQVHASPPLSAKLKSLARALAPLSPNATNADSPTIPSTPGDSGLFNLFNSCDGTPMRTPMMSPSTNDAETPYERFSRSSLAIRHMLVEQYLDILNTAPREQLLLLKGFGERRTDSILELRKASPRPLKHLDDLEKIGLSSKQAYAIFNSNVVRQVSFCV